MSLPDLKIIERIGDLRGGRYDFDHVGDEIPLHVHQTEVDNHVTIVARGRIKVYNHHRSDEYEAPTMIAHKVGTPHAIMALTDGACIFNIRTSLGGERYTPDVVT
jgi:quercetin dioxygenase-like cupin family protein